MSKAGYRGGFNPFRDNHGHWTTGAGGESASASRPSGPTGATAPASRPTGTPHAVHGDVSVHSVSDGQGSRYEVWRGTTHVQSYEATRTTWRQARADAVAHAERSATPPPAPAQASGRFPEAGSPEDMQARQAAGRPPAAEIRYQSIDYRVFNRADRSGGRAVEIWNGDQLAEVIPVRHGYGDAEEGHAVERVRERMRTAQSERDRSNVALAAAAAATRPTPRPQRDMTDNEAIAAAANTPRRPPPTGTPASGAPPASPGPPAPTHLADGTPRDVLSIPHFNGRHRVTSEYTGNLDDATQIMFGRPMSLPEVAALSGAPDGARVTLSGADTHITLTITHPLYDRPSVREIYYTSNKTVIKNSILRIHPDAPQGFGTHVLASQVRAARAAGVKELKLYAAGSPHDRAWNGFYSWPRMGFVGPLSDNVITFARRAGFTLSDSATTADLMRQPGGAEWWKRSGTGGNMTFDLSDDSVSMQVHTDYLREKGHTS